MSSVPSQSDLISIEEYFQREEASEAKHDYIDGRIYAMAGGSPEHSLIAMNVGSEARGKLKGKPCRVYGSDLLISIPRKPFTHYPDVSIICGDVQFDPRDRRKHTAVNPTVVFEVLSPSTAKYDRSVKFDHYRELETFREYVLIFQDKREIHTFFLHDDGTWTFNVLTSVSKLPLRSVQIELDIDEIYAGITFPPEAETNGAVESPLE